MAQLARNNMVAYQVRISGLVQGVGFRPYVFRLADKFGLNGWVMNRTNGLVLKIEGNADSISGFLHDLPEHAPVISDIEEIIIDKDTPEGITGFNIKSSEDLNDETSEISPDIAVCAGCLSDLKLQPRRREYPFINCTNCGPRFTIIRDFPYDRKNTTMDTFTMCPSCHSEYQDILDRRFHAQPVACNDCGPEYALHIGDQIIRGFPAILERTVSIIANGGIIAVKGMGGFHLMCDAGNENSVDRLRKSKKREGKPFAVMFRDISCLLHYAHVSKKEETALLSWKRPIVILNTKKQPAYAISLGMETLGAFLPYMAWHYLFFEKSGLDAIVLTSGNLAEEPIIIDNQNAIGALSPITDGVLTFDRDIYNRTDDSVVRVIGGKERIFRRSRGYVPAPVKLHFDVNAILATGAEYSGCFCLGKENRAYLSQHIGDIKNQETFAFYEETLARFQKLFRIKPLLVVSDLHPDYLTTRFARTFGTEVTAVQHHHAHVASCMAENGIDEPVIGIAFDGTGYGTDGNSWGSEFLVCDYAAFTRYSHFEYMRMPGGDKAAGQPWRMGLSLLYQAFGNNLIDLDIPLIRLLDHKNVVRIVEAIEKRINCPLSSGAGRLFDAVAAITGVCVNSLFHAEAPMRLESVLNPDVQDRYDFETNGNISFRPAILQICNDLMQGTATGIISARFHNTITAASLNMARHIRSETGINKVVLSGGTFQNKYLFESLENNLLKDNFAVFGHTRVPCNDGGLALGQLAVAARGKRIGK